MKNIFVILLSICIIGCNVSKFYASKRINHSSTCVVSNGEEPAEKTSPAKLRDEIPVKNAAPAFPLYAPGNADTSCHTIAFMDNSLRRGNIYRPTPKDVCYYKSKTPIQAKYRIRNQFVKDIKNSQGSDFFFEKGDEPKKRADPLGVISFAFGIFSLVLAAIQTGLALAPGLLSVIFGMICLSKNDPGTRKWGAVLGLLFCLVAILLLFYLPTI